jgi:hypothetical protein
VRDVNDAVAIVVDLYNNSIVNNDNNNNNTNKNNTNNNNTTNNNNNNNNNPSHVRDSQPKPAGHGNSLETLPHATRVFDISAMGSMEMGPIKIGPMEMGAMEMGASILADVTDHMRGVPEAEASVVDLASKQRPTNITDNTSPQPRRKKRILSAKYALM